MRLSSGISIIQENKWFSPRKKMAKKQYWCKRWSIQKHLHLFTIGKWTNLWWPTLSQPHFGQVWGWSPTLGKVEDLESSGTPERLELDNKAQNTLHWGVLNDIGKVLKRRYRKWPRIGHLDICNPSYGQKKGRESNWQFDSRPLKVRNRPVPDVRSGSATWRWKVLFKGYNFGSYLVPIRGRGEELWSPKVPGLQPGTVSGLHFGSPGKKWHSDATPASKRRVYYRE
jgi:hypothetical protein